MIDFLFFVLVFWKKKFVCNRQNKKNTNLSHTYVTYGKHSGFLFSSLKFFFFLWWQKFCKICLNETCQIKVFFLSFFVFWHVFLAINVCFFSSKMTQKILSLIKQEETNKNSWLSFTLFFLFDNNNVTTTFISIINRLFHYQVFCSLKFCFEKKEFTVYGCHL